MQTARELALAEARRAGVPEDLFLRLIKQESGWNPQARSPAGALGLTQAMPATWRQPGFGVQPGGDINDQQEQLRFGADYMSAMLNRYGGDPVRAAAAYNWGAGNVDRWDGNPASLPAETRGYINAVANAGISGEGGDIAMMGGEGSDLIPREDYSSIMDPNATDEKGVTFHPGLGLQSIGAALAATSAGESASDALDRIRKRYFDERSAELDAANQERQLKAVAMLVQKHPDLVAAVEQGADPNLVMQELTARETRDQQIFMQDREFEFNRENREDTQEHEFGVLDYKGATEKEIFEAAQLAEGEKMEATGREAQLILAARVSQEPGLGQAAAEQLMRMNPAAFSDPQMVNQFKDMLLRDPTTLMQNIQEINRLRATGNLADMKTADAMEKAVTSGGVTVNTGENKARDFAYKRLETEAANLDKGLEMRAGFEQMQSLLAQHGGALGTGIAATVLEPAASFLSDLGLTPADFTTRQNARRAMSQITTRLAPYSRGDGSGATSDMEFMAYKFSNPGFGTPEELLPELLDRAISEITRKERRLENVGRMVEQEGMSYFEANSAWNKMVREGAPETNPYFADLDTFTNENFQAMLNQPNFNRDNPVRYKGRFMSLDEALDLMAQEGAK